MPSNCNNSKQSCGLYKPPHLRPGYVDKLNNNVAKFADKNSKVKNKILYLITQFYIINKNIN